MLVRNEPGKTWSANVDNFDESNTDTYQQRYYVNDIYWQGTGPVFLYIGGEGTLNGPPGRKIEKFSQLDLHVYANKHSYIYPYMHTCIIPSLSWFLVTNIQVAMSRIWVSSILPCWSRWSTGFTASLFRTEMPLLRTTSTWLSSKLLLISQASLPTTRVLYQRQRMWNGWHLVARTPALSPHGTGRLIPLWQWARSPPPESWTALSTTRFATILFYFIATNTLTLYVWRIWKGFRYASLCGCRQRVRRFYSQSPASLPENHRTARLTLPDLFFFLLLLSILN